MVNEYIEELINIANDDTHGYAQDNRYGCDYDCSSLVAHCLIAAGFGVSKYSTTRNLYTQLKQCGFVDIADINNRKKGDIFLTPGKHVVTCISEDQIVHATSNENGGITNGTPGDQTGREITIDDFYVPSYGWQYHLRYNDENKITELITGMLVILDNTPSYESETGKSNRVRSGQYYLWSTEIVNGRVRITNSLERVGVKGQVTCWVDVTSIIGHELTNTTYKIMSVTTALYLRQNIKDFSNFIVIMPENAMVKILEEKDGWYNVQYGSHTGWCNGKYLAEV